MGPFRLLVENEWAARYVGTERGMAMAARGERPVRVPRDRTRRAARAVAHFATNCTPPLHAANTSTGRRSRRQTTWTLDVFTRHDNEHAAKVD